MTENEVYNSVSRLFENEVDLLRDFNTFLPDVAQQQRRPVEQPQGQAAMAELISQGGQIGHLSKGPHSTAAEATAHPCAALTVAGDQQKVVAAEKRPIEQQPTQQQRKEGGGGGEPPPKKQQLIPPVLPVGKKRLTETQLAALEQTKV
jgi:histone deacetylase complex regulatory component SIN3